jgi:hypothetical protein
MPMSEFTPGPWRYWWEEGYVGEINSANGKLVAGFDTEPNEADARLIAAAPELLGALMMLDIRGGLGLQTHEYIRSIITKATGEQQ